MISIRAKGFCAVCRRVSARVILSALVCATAAAPPAARTRTGPGLLREIQVRLTQAQGVEIWEEARRLPSAEDAAPLMEHLAGRTQDPLYSARAALWLGHYHYGAGQIEPALQHFTRAAAAGRDSPVVMPEAAFWAAQCRNLLGLPVGGSDEEEGPDAPSGLFRRLAEFDGHLRLGDLDSALNGYLSLEGMARRVRCLAPLYYRLGLVMHAGGGRGTLDASMTRGWASTISGSAERALVGAIGDAATGSSREEPSLNPDFREPSLDLPGDPVTNRP